MLKVRAKSKPCCPLCRVELDGDRYVCTGCDTEYHRDCADELGGCGTLGCKRMGVKPDAETPNDQGWRSRARRRTDANRARRASARRMRQEHVGEGLQPSTSWIPGILEALFYLVWIVFEILG